MISDTLKAVLIIAVTSLVLIGIWVYQNRYTIVTAGGAAYKINRLSGEVWWLRTRWQHPVTLKEPEENVIEGDDPYNLFPELKK